MTAAEVKAALGAAAGRSWPEAQRASDLPFPAYWKRVAEWLVFHAPHVGDRLMLRFVEEAVRLAKEGEEAGVEPKHWEIPEKVREAWRLAELCSASGAGEVAEDEERRREAWEHAAERAAEVRDRSAARRRGPVAVQGELR